MQSTLVQLRQWSGRLEGLYVRSYSYPCILQAIGHWYLLNRSKRSGQCKDSALIILRDTATKAESGREVEVKHSGWACKEHLHSDHYCQGDSNKSLVALVDVESVLVTRYLRVKVDNLEVDNLEEIRQVGGQHS